VAIDPGLFRAVLRRWASGVTIVTTHAGAHDAGMTVSAFSSVSLDPPLVLVCADKKAKTRPLIDASGIFAVNVLAEDQHELSNRFAKDGNEDVRFHDLVCRRGPSGALWLPDTLAVLDCRVESRHDAGDHVIYVGHVIAAEVHPTRAPLVYCDAGYRSIAPKQ
jgi:flavin reductase (DIM6/NTAB) family NADH-FMN oxidoreductase RutF